MKKMKKSLILIVAVTLILSLCACGNNPAQEDRPTFLGKWSCGTYADDGTLWVSEVTFSGDNTVEIFDYIPNSDVGVVYNGTWRIESAQPGSRTIKLKLIRSEFDYGETIEEACSATVTIDIRLNRISFRLVDGDNPGLLYEKDYRHGEWTEDSINYIDMSDLPLKTALTVG